MAGNRLVLGALTLAAGLTLFAPAGESAQCAPKPAYGTLLGSYTTSGGVTRQSSHTTEFAAQRRPNVIVYPRSNKPGPNSRRQCRSWLEKEYRVSGPVIVPKMRCWWE